MAGVDTRDGGGESTETTLGPDGVADGAAAMPIRPEDVDGAAAVGGHDAGHAVVVDLGALRPALMRGGRVFLETVTVPSVLLYVMLHLVSLTAGLCAVLVWCCLTVGTRRLFGRELPGTLLLCTGMLCGRALVALLLSSAVAFLVQPVVGSIVMAALFLGSAAIGRPITVRLARDFIALPAHLFHHRPVRRMFTQVALIWGVSRLFDAGMSIWFIGNGFDLGLLSRGVFSTLLSAVTVAACAGWGWRVMRRIPGITLRMG
jgi:hypothetical protein